MVKNKNQNKKSIVKRLQDKNEIRWKEVCTARDGRECMVAKHYGFIKVPHSEIIQVDHNISRTNKILKFDPRNGTTVCSNCNMFKKNKQFSIDRAIDDIVKKREGDFYYKMVEIDQMRKPNLDFGNIGWLEKNLHWLDVLLIHYTDNNRSV